MPVLTSYRNQSMDLLCKSIDWFLYEGKTGIYWVDHGVLSLFYQRVTGRTLQVWVPDSGRVPSEVSNKKLPIRSQHLNPLGHSLPPDLQAITKQKKLVAHANEVKINYSTFYLLLQKINSFSMGVQDWVSPVPIFSGEQSAQVWMKRLCAFHENNTKFLLQEIFLGSKYFS